jgi:hypothetical protein
MSVCIGGDWTDEEITRFLSREKRLIAQGLTDTDAEKLAEQLVYRDRPGSGDERHLCLECSNGKRWPCQAVPVARRPANRLVLVLCDKFKITVNKPVVQV